MRRQLTQEQSSAIAADLTFDPRENLVEAFQEALEKITAIYPQFTMRDWTSVWNARHPGFQWDKSKSKSFNFLVKAEGSKKGFWVMSGGSCVEAVEASREREVKQAPDEENLTKPWMMQALNDGLHKKIALSVKKKFPQESLEDLASDVSELMMLWGQRGQCDEFLKRGKPPTVAILAVWSEQKIRQRTYKDATDALQREFRSLRTQTEIRKRREKNMEDLILDQGLTIDPNSLKTIWVIREDETREVVIVAPEPEEDSFFSESPKLDLLRNFVRIKRKRSPDRYARVFDHIKAGTPKGEVALLEGCSELTVSHLVQKVREDLKEGSKFLSVALMLLKKISEEPFSTLDEIKQDNSGLEDSKIEQALKALLLGDLISEKQGRSFQATKAGLVLSGEI